jgi:hypothetical protein
MTSALRKAMAQVTSAIVIALNATPALAAPADEPHHTLHCAKRSAIIEQFQRLFDEVRVVRAMTRDDQVVEILASPTGSWSMILTLPGGAACLIGSGLDFEVYPPPMPGQPS